MSGDEVGPIFKEPKLLIFIIVMLVAVWVGVFIAMTAVTDHDRLVCELRGGEYLTGSFLQVRYGACSIEIP